MNADPHADAKREPPEKDGRRRRSASSRRRIVEAMLDLVRAGQVAPSADDIALRAGVGRRTVFRLFSDLGGIYTEIQSIMRARIAPVRTMPLVGDTSLERLHALIDRRVHFFEEVMHVSVAAAIHRHRSARLQADHAAIQTELRAILLDVLGPDLAPDPATRQAIEAVLSIDMWRRLRLEQGQDAAASAAILHRLADALLQGG
jgi:AcrR family transcriptional regulator